MLGCCQNLVLATAMISLLDQTPFRIVFNFNFLIEVQLVVRRTVSRCIGSLQRTSETL